MNTEAQNAIRITRYTLGRRCQQILEFCFVVLFHWVCGTTLQTIKLSGTQDEDLENSRNYDCW